MPSIEHEVPNLLIRENPALITHFCERLGIQVPEGCEPHLGSEDVTDKVDEGRKDRSVVYRKPGGEKALAVVFEVQRADEKDKHRSWPWYLASARWHNRCPAVLIVFATDPGTARWSRQPIELGHPGLTLIPLVIGPEDITKITDPDDAAANIELAVLSAVFHGNDITDGPDVLEAAFDAVDSTGDADQRGMYADFIRSSLKDIGRIYWENLMRTKGYRLQSDIAVKARAEGHAEGLHEGQARMLLRILRSQGIPLTEEAEARILQCTDTTLLDRWAETALSGAIDTAADLFQD